MIYKSLFIQVLIRLSSILLLSFLMGWIFWATAYPYMAILVLMLILWLSYGLVHYLNTTNRLLSQFFLSVKNEDSALSFPKNISGKSFGELRRGMQEVNYTIRDLRIKAQKKEMISDAIIEHASVGLLSFDENGLVECINHRGRELLGVHNLYNIKALQKNDVNLFELFEIMKAGDTRVYHLQGNGVSKYLLISCTTIKQENKELKLLSFTDIKNEMDAQELESWQKLINVLTHEIMNSVSPLTCLSEKLESNYQQIETGTVLTESVLTKTRNGLQVIKEQGQGLMYFVEAYRELSRIPKPNPQAIVVSQLFRYLQDLLHMYSNEQVQYHFSISPKDLQLYADEALVKQVLINLVKNARQAIHSNGEIFLTAEEKQDGHVEIRITDTGCGISVEDMKNIFIPFFTTKEEGSGIGLSLTRQIMRLHNGNISIESEEGEGTKAKLVFPIK
ncbi:PAS domain-containing sensor histidine kinase [Marinifilum sp. D714]|uniref:sensor histidine kinase n=1 Tax=Marinifilum sp. D714 TaxID=2937523 RepID=UPI0027C9782C|nr:ATP-binding protein [Marinifilum sp. D714]MDQ2180024.1 ATP-binding protein [Marinifilum sp. D714]